MKDILNEVYELEGLLHLLSRSEEAGNTGRREEIRGLAEGKTLGILAAIRAHGQQPSAVSEISEISEISAPSDLPPVSEISELPEVQEAPAQRGEPQFAINDKFRFRRELFGGRDADFKASLQLLTQFADFNQAEDYFYNDLQWDADNPTVAEFMEIIRKYYGK